MNTEGSDNGRGGREPGNDAGPAGTPSDFGCPNTERLLLWTEGVLEGHEANEVGRHVSACSTCAEVVRWIRGMSGALRTAGSAEADPAEAGAAVREHPDEELLAAFADGSIDPSRAQEVEEHISRCGACLAEVADLWALAGPDIADAPDRSVAAVLDRLSEEAGTAVLRWAARSLTLVRDFATARVEEARGAAERWGPAPQPAPARGDSGEVRLRWYGSEGLAVDGLVRTTGEHEIALTGRVTLRGEPARTVSVTVGSTEGTRGPESLDARGRFGPWPLGEGRNSLRLTGIPGSGDSVELSVVVSREPEGQ